MRRKIGGRVCVAHRIDRLGVEREPRNQRGPAAGRDDHSFRFKHLVAELHATDASTFDVHRTDGGPTAKGRAFPLGTQGHRRKQLLWLDLGVLRNAQSAQGFRIGGRLLVPEVFAAPAIASHAVDL
jgi:hypothetical protein